MQKYLPSGDVIFLKTSIEISVIRAARGCVRLIDINEFCEILCGVSSFEESSGRRVFLLALPKETLAERLSKLSLEHVSSGGTWRGDWMSNAAEAGSRADRQAFTLSKGKR